MTPDADQRRPSHGWRAAFVIALVVTVAAGLLVRGYLTGDQWVATVGATVRGVVTPVLGPTP